MALYQKTQTLIPVNINEFAVFPQDYFPFDIESDIHKYVLEKVNSFQAIMKLFYHPLAFWG